MKYGNKNYLQLPRVIFDPQYADMKTGTLKFYLCLKEKEHQLCNEQNNNKFYRSDWELANDFGLSLSFVKRAKADLYNYPELVKITVEQKITNYGNRYEEVITYYEIM